MFTSIADFEQRLAEQQYGTLMIFGALTNKSLTQAVADGHRTLGRIAWHIVVTFNEMMGKAGVNFKGPESDSDVPSSVAEISRVYKETTDNLLAAVKEQWDDAALQEEQVIYNSPWKNGYTLAVLIEHEVHHRGQMTVLMRQAGLKVPGYYGPAKEQWAQYGMEQPPGA